MKLKYLLSAIVLMLTMPFVLAVDLSELMSPDDVMLRKPSKKQAPALTPSETQAAKDDVDRRFAEAKARAEAEAAARARLDAEAARRIREAAEKKAAAEKAAAEKAAAEAAAKAEAERKAAEAKKAADEMKRLREQVAEEKAAREKAEKKVAYLQNPDPDEKPQPKKLVAPTTDDRDVTETIAGAATADAPKKKDKAKSKKGDQKKAGTKREAVITSDRTDYDRKEGIILFDRNVCVDDEQYQMHADRLFVFLDGTNDLKRLVAIGHVAITNEEKSASCTRAVYTKATSKIVMYGDDANMARLHDASKKGGTVKGRRIIFWLNSEEVEVEGSQIEMPTGSLKAGSPKDFFDKAK